MSTFEFGVDVEACRRTFRERHERELARREASRLSALEAVRRAIHRCAPRHSSTRRVYLFGSVVRPRAFRPDSDVDVAVEGTSATEYFELWRDLERAAPEWVIDLRDLGDDSAFADRVRESGVLVYERTTPAPQV